MLNFYEMCLKLDEVIEGNPAPAHSNITKNRRVIDHGAHLDRALQDKIGAVSSRRDDADYSPEIEPARNAAEELAGLGDTKDSSGNLVNATFEGDTARMIHNAIVNNPTKYQSGVSIPLTQFVAMLQKDSFNDKGMKRSMGTIKLENLLRGIQTLARKTSAPLFELTKGADGKYSVAFKAFQGDASKLRRPGEAAKQVALNPDEDRLAKPGEGKRYSSIQNKAGLTQAPAGAVSPVDANALIGPKQSFNKAFDVAIHTGLGTPLQQAADAYKQALSNIIGNPNTLPDVRMQYAKEKQQVDQKVQEFIGKWKAHNLNPQIPGGA